MITPETTTLSGELRDLAARVRTLELPSYGALPRLVACAPAASRSVVDGRVPYAVIVKDSNASWDSAWRFWVVPASGLYLVQIQAKCAGTPTTSVLHFHSYDPVTATATARLYGGVNSLVSYGDHSLSGVVDLIGGHYVWTAQDISYTPNNDTPALSNYLMITYLGRTT